MNSNNEIQGYKMYPMLHFCRKSSSGVTARESGRMESFLFYFFLIESLTFVIFLRVEIDEGSLLGPCLHLRSS